MPAFLRSIGTATPPHRMDQSHAATASKAFSCTNEREGRLLGAIFSRSEVRTRASVILEPPNGIPLRQNFYPPMTSTADRGPSTACRMERFAAESADLAVDAAYRAIADAEVLPQQVTHVVVVTCTGFQSPGIDVALIRRLELSPTVQRLQIGFMGCHGAINGMRAAQAIALADSGACVLLCAVELCSLHFYYGWDVEKVKANALFADGAAAAIITGEPSSPGPGKGWHIAATGSCLLPDSEQDMTWRIGDHGFEMTLSARVPELIQSHLRPWIDDWLAEHHHTVTSIRNWAIHPGGPRIVSAAAECLRLPDSTTAVSRAVLEEYGNMSSPTLLFILERMRRSELSGPTVALGFGPGLMAEAALLE